MITEAQARIGVQLNPGVVLARCAYPVIGGWDIRRFRPIECLVDAIPFDQAVVNAFEVMANTTQIDWKKTVKNNVEYQLIVYGWLKIVVDIQRLTITAVARLASRLFE